MQVGSKLYYCFKLVAMTLNLPPFYCFWFVEYCQPSPNENISANLSPLTSNKHLSLLYFWCELFKEGVGPIISLLQIHCPFHIMADKYPKVIITVGSKCLTMYKNHFSRSIHIFIFLSNFTIKMAHLSLEQLLKRCFCQNSAPYNGCRHLCWMILFISYPFICFYRTAWYLKVNCPVLMD